MFLKLAWKMFRERFIFASGLLPDTDCIFWENVLADERRAEKHGWVWKSMARQGQRPRGPGGPAHAGW